MVFNFVTSSNPSAQDRNKYGFIIRCAAFLSIAIGILVMSGWIFDIHYLRSAYQGANTMKFNSAVSFALLGIAILYLDAKRHLVSDALASAILIFTGLTFFQDIFHYSAGIDELLLRDYVTLRDGKVSPGRMSPTTSLSFVMMSGALLLVRSSSNLVRNINQFMLHFVSLISFVAILGYIYNVPSFYKLSFFVSMAVHTAGTFLSLSVSVSLFNPRLGLAGIFTGDEIGNVMARRIFTMAGTAILLLGFLGLELDRYSVMSLQFEISLFTTSFFMVCLFIIVITVKHLNAVDQKRSKAEHSLKILNRTLEQKVKDRTEELARSEYKFVKIFEMSPAGLIVSDVDTGEFLDVNQRFLSLTGYHKAEVLSQTSGQLGLISDQDRAEKRHQIQSGGEIKNQETIYYTKAGERRNAVMSVELIEVDGRKIALTVLHDITEIKIVEHELLAAKQLAEESSVSKERFMANMSHEIRTPMNAIIGFTNLIEHTQLNKEQEQYLSFIKNSGENLLVLINDILDYSKIEAGMMQLERVPFNIADLMQSLQIMFSGKAKEKNLYLSVNISDDIPRILIGDPTRLTQILINLIGNAVKFTSEGGVSVEIKRLSGQDGQLLVGLSVKDTGIGIPENKHRDIFERFMQASSETTRNYGGTGLGLSIVKRLVELQKGEINISSTEGIGTKFYVELPYHIAKSDLSELEQTGDDKVEIKVFDPPLNVLLAEDNVMNQLLAKKVLSQFGCEVHVAENGSIAVEMASSGNYDIILMDIQMPLMDGYAASTKIRKEINLTVPIIAMTAHVMAGEREKCISMGMTDYISKPFKVEHLYKLIKKYTQVPDKA